METPIMSIMSIMSSRSMNGVTLLSSCFQLRRTSCRLWMRLIAWLDPPPASAASQSSCRAVTANAWERNWLWNSIKHPKSVRKSISWDFGKLKALSSQSVCKTWHWEEQHLHHIFAGIVAKTSHQVPSTSTGTNASIQASGVRLRTMMPHLLQQSVRRLGPKWCGLNWLDKIAIISWFGYNNHSPPAI